MRLRNGVTARRILPFRLRQVKLTKPKEHTSPSFQIWIFPHDARYLRRAFTKAVQAAGLGAFRFHDLRHTFASRLAMQGCNDRTIMELGGWESPRMLKRYAHIAPTHLWQAVEGLTAPPTGCKTGCYEKVVENEKLGYALETFVFEGKKNWSGKGDLNPRPSPWQGDKT
jgi:hypothetical protein